MKRIIASLLAGLCLLALVGCSAGSKTDSAAPKDYSQTVSYTHLDVYKRQGWSHRSAQ